MAPPPGPANAFEAINPGAKAGQDAPKLAKAELMPIIKTTILEHKTLPKQALIGILSHKVGGVTVAEARGTLDHIAEKKGTGRQKFWTLKPGWEV